MFDTYNNPPKIGMDFNALLCLCVWSCMSIASQVHTLQWRVSSVTTLTWCCVHIVYHFPRPEPYTITHTHTSHRGMQLLQYPVECCSLWMLQPLNATIRYAQGLSVWSDWNVFCHYLRPCGGNSRSVCGRLKMRWDCELQMVDSISP